MSKSSEKILYEELARCYDDPLRFVLWAFPWGETPETSLVKLKSPWKERYPNCEYGPDRWACEFLDALGAEVKARGFDGTHAVDPIRMAVSSGHGIGKSALTAWLVCWIMATRPNSKGVVTANTANQLETKTWAEIRKWLKRSLVADMFEIKAMSIEAKGSAETWRVDALTCREENAEAFAGLHAASATPFYLFDEASAIPEKIYEVAEGGLTDGEPMMFLFGNPTRSSGTFHACFHNRKKRDHWKLRTIDSRTVDVTNKEQLARWEEEYGEESDFFRVRVRGLFPNVSSQQFIPTGLITAATGRPALNNHPNVAVIGVDVARYGDDDTVIFFRFGRDGSYPYRKYSGLSTTQVVARVKEAIRDAQLLGFKKVYCFIDEGGVGGGPVDILRDDGFEQVRGVNFGWSADDPKSWNRKRDEMWGRMREWLKTATLKDDEDLATDLTAPEYEILLNGATKLESKEHMKKRGVSSPDIADALALTFAYQVQEYGTDMSEVCEDARKKRLEFNPFKTIGNWLS